MSCSLPKNNTQKDVLLMQLKREIEQHKNDVTAQLLIHDKKMAELCCYIKENLSSEIRVLLDTMDQTGELDKIITDTVLSSVSVLQAKTDHIANVIEQGVVGDGKTDDSVPLQRAIENVSDVLFFPKGEYLITKDITITKDDVKLSGHDAVFTFKNGAKLTFKDCKNINVQGIKFKNGALGFAEVNGFTVYDCTFTSGTYGLIGSHCYVGDINRCEFNGCTNGLIFDKDLLASSATPDHNSIFITGCKFYNNVKPFVIRGGYVGRFCDNMVEGNGQGIIVEGMADYTIRSNYFEYNKGTIITLNTYKGILNTDVVIGGNRIFGDSSNTITGLALSGTIMGLVLETNSWGGLYTLIDKGSAILSRPMLYSQVNNTSKTFPSFPVNVTTIDGTMLLPQQSSDPSVVAGRLYVKNDYTVAANTKLGDYVLDYKLGYIPQLNVAPQEGEKLMWVLPNGELQIKIDGVVKTIAFKE